MEIFVLFLIIFVIYGAGWIWQTVTDVVRDINRQNWDNRVYGQVASSRSIKKKLGGKDVAALRKIYGELAEDLDAQLHDRALFESPKISYVYKTSRVLLSIYETRQSPPRFYTQVTFTLPAGWPHRLEIFPQRFKDTDVRYRNVGDIQIGQEEFDSRYIIKSSDPEFPAMFLDNRIRSTVEMLRNLSANDKILISINSSRLMVRKQSILSEMDELKKYVDLGSRLFDRIFDLWQKESGIEILEDDESSAANPSPAVCQVCGSELQQATTVFCRRCRTPHHDECWSYNEGCSTFACGETKFRNKF